MPNCFQLYRVDDPEEKAIKLSDVDNEICAHFGVEPDPKYYFHSWFDVIGFSLACGKDFDHFINNPQLWTETMVKIAQFMKTRYGFNAWAER